MLYGTADQLKIRVQQLSTPSADQVTMMEELLEAASRCLDRVCKRPDNDFVADSVASAKYFSGHGESYLHIPNCTEVTGVAVRASLTATTYTAWTTPTTPMAGDGDWIPCKGDSKDPVFGVPPYNLLLLDQNGEYTYFLDGGGRPVIMVTAKWHSEAVVPADIREACLMQAAIWLKKFQGSMASELGPVDFAQIKYRRGLDSGVKQILIDGGWVIPLYGGA